MVTSPRLTGTALPVVWHVPSGQGILMMDLLWRPCSEAGQESKLKRCDAWENQLVKASWVFEEHCFGDFVPAEKNKTYHGALIPWMLRNITFFEWSLPTDILSHTSSHTWVFLKMVDPQVTMGFNTKSWSSMTTGWYLRAPPWLRKPPYILTC